MLISFRVTCHYDLEPSLLKELRMVQRRLVAVFLSIERVAEKHVETGTRAAQRPTQPTIEQMMDQSKHLVVKQWYQVVGGI